MYTFLLLSFLSDDVEEEEEEEERLHKMKAKTKHSVNINNSIWNDDTSSVLPIFYLTRKLGKSDHFSPKNLTKI